MKKDYDICSLMRSSIWADVLSILNSSITFPSPRSLFYDPLGGVLARFTSHLQMQLYLAVQIIGHVGDLYIGTTVGGLPDVIEDGKSGMLAKPENPISLAETINRLLENPVLTKEMGEYAEYLAKNVYSWDYIVNIYIESFDDQLEKPTTLHPKV